MSTARAIELAHHALAVEHRTWMRDFEKHAIRKYYLGDTRPTSALEPTWWYCELLPVMINVVDESTGATHSKISARISLRLFEPTKSRDQRDQVRVDELSPEAIEKFAEVKSFVDAWVNGELAELPPSTCESHFKINDRVAWMSSLDVGDPKVEFVGTIVGLGFESVDAIKQTADGGWTEDTRAPAARVRPDAPQHGLTQTDMVHPNHPMPLVKLSNLRKL